MFKKILNLLKIPFAFIDAFCFVARFPLRRNSERLIVILRNTSFGHQIINQQYLLNMMSSSPITIITIDDESRVNKHLYDLFENENINTIRFQSFFKLENSNHTARFLHLFIFLRYVFNDTVHIIKVLNIKHTIFHMFPTKVPAGINLQHFDEDKNQISEYSDLTTFMELYELGLLRNNKINENIFSDIRWQIEQRHPNFFKKPFVTFLFRNKRGDKFYDVVRDCGNYSSYQKAINWLHSEGYNVVVTAGPGQAKDIEVQNAYNLHTLNVDSQLLNLFLIVKCDRFVSQHSGAYILANVCDIPVTIVNSFPPYIGTFNSEDVILLKNFYVCDKKLTAQDGSLQSESIFWGRLDRAVDIVNNSEDQILEAIQGVNAVKCVFPKESLIHYSRNWIAQ